MTTDGSRVILHVDLNSFFAMAQQQVNPALRGKPVGVVKARGRTCIIAASPEAKKKGVGTGSRTYDAKRLCPDIILVPADFDKYSDISRRFIKICADYSPLCEVFSLDECFIDVTATEQFWGTAFDIAFDIKKRLREEVGDYLTVSIGVSHNKLLAKLAGEQIKPDGLFWITEDNAHEILDRSSFMDVCGIGWGLNNHLLKLGVDGFSKLRTCSREFLHINFGPFWGPYLWDICRGVDRAPVNSFRAIPEQKSVSRTYTTHRLLTKRDEIFKIARNLCEEAAFKARRMGLAGRYVGFGLRGGRGGKNFWGHVTMKAHIDDGKELFDVCRTVSKDWDIKEVIFCGVTLGMLGGGDGLTIPLFEKDVKRGRLTSAGDAINEKYGEYTVFPAQLLGMPIVMPEVTGYFGDRKYQIKRMGL